MCEAFFYLKTLKSLAYGPGVARGAAAPPNYGQLRFFGQQEKIWAKPVFKNISMLLHYFEEINIFLFQPEFGVITQLHSHETVVAYHVMSFWLLGKGIIGVRAIFCQRGR